MNTHSIYRVLPGRKTAAGSIPANLTTLSVSLIGDRFEAVAVGRGAITGTWVCPTPVTGASEFGAAIKQAVQETAFRGTTAQLVLAHPRLVSVLTSAPPVRGSSLDKVIERQAQREKPFDGEAAWCHQPTLSVKGSGTILLHLFPRALLDQFSRACEKAANLTLVAATPATAVLHGQILHLPVNTNAAILVATPVGDTTLLVVAQRDGQLFLARTIPASWEGNAAHFITDLNRTLLFAGEQLGAQVEAVFLFDGGKGDLAPELQESFQVAVRRSPVELVPGYWATEALKLPSGMGPNLIGVEQQKAPQRRAMTRITALATAAVMIGAALVWGWSQLYIGRLREDIQKLKTEKARVEAHFQSLQSVYADLISMRAMCAKVTEDRPAPMPAWVLGLLSESLPNALLLKQVSVTAQGELWSTRLHGVLQPTTNSAPELLLSSAVSTLTNRLGQAPLFMLPTRSDTKSSPATDAPGLAQIVGAWAGRLGQANTNLLANVAQGFIVEGVIE